MASFPGSASAGLGSGENGCSSHRGLSPEGPSSLTLNVFASFRFCHWVLLKFLTRIFLRVIVHRGQLEMVHRAEEGHSTEITQAAGSSNHPFIAPKFPQTLPHFWPVPEQSEDKHTHTSSSLRLQIVQPGTVSTKAAQQETQQDKSRSSGSKGSSSNFGTLHFRNSAFVPDKCPFPQRLLKVSFPRLVGSLCAVLAFSPLPVLSDQEGVVLAPRLSSVSHVHPAPVPPCLQAVLILKGPGLTGPALPHFPPKEAAPSISVGSGSSSSSPADSGSGRDNVSPHCKKDVETLEKSHLDGLWLPFLLASQGVAMPRVAWENKTFTPTYSPWAEVVTVVVAPLAELPAELDTEEVGEERGPVLEAGEGSDEGSASEAEMGPGQAGSHQLPSGSDSTCTCAELPEEGNNYKLRADVGVRPQVDGEWPLPSGLKEELKGRGLLQETTHSCARSFIRSSLMKICLCNLGGAGC
ncbi:hypothetical protein L345_14837, partial [Ophiophagus hannah]